MAYLAEIIPYKKEIIKVLIDNSNIVNAIDSSKTEVPEELIWNNIFPFFKVPNIADKQEKVYITIDMYAPKIIDKTYKELAIVFNIFAHENKQRTQYGYTIVDYLQSEIDKLFNGKDNFGIGYLELKSNNLLKINDSYFGTTLVYWATNFNNDACNI